MADYQENVNSDEEKYANDSFETDVPESSVYGSDDDEPVEGGKLMLPTKESRAYGRNNEFWTCESSSDEDDVVLGHTIAEINTDPGDFDNENLSLTPAARVFKMASAKRNSQSIKDIADDDDELTECEDFEDEIDDIDKVDEALIPTDDDAENIFQRYTKLSTEDEIVYEEHSVLYTSGIDMEEVYTDIGPEDGGEVDVGEPNLLKELGDKKGSGKKSVNKVKNDEKTSYSTMKSSVNSSDDYCDDDEKTIGASSLVEESFQSDQSVGTNSKTRKESKNETQSETKSDTKSETKSLRTDDSMEDLKRKVMLSQRIYCGSDGSGDYIRSKSRKSGIPIWIGSNERLDKLDPLKTSHSAPGVRSMIPIPDTRSHCSMPEFSDTETLTPNERDYNGNENGSLGFDRLAGGDYNDYMTDGFISEYDNVPNKMDGGSSAYEMQMFMDSNHVPQKPKKLKAGERRNKSFSNERLRDIERHNHILLHKILNQKPTYILDEKKKKKDKFATLPPTTRVTSAEINRKKQQRQIDMDNQLLKRKLEAIAKRLPKTKQN